MPAKVADIPFRRYCWCIARVRAASDAEGDTRSATAAYRKRIDIALPSLSNDLARERSVRVMSWRGTSVLLQEDSMTMSNVRVMDRLRIRIRNMPICRK